MKKVIKQKHMLHVLANASPKLRKVILKYGDDKLITALAEVFVNILNGNIPIGPKTKKKLNQYRHIFRRLDSCCRNKKRINKPKVRRLVNQVGGALPFALPLIIPFLAKAIAGGAAAAGGGALVRKLVG